MRLYLSRLGFIDEEILMAFWSRWKRWQKWTAGIVGALFALGVMGSFVEKEVPNVVGSSLPDAVQVLKTEGFGTVSVTDEHGASVLKSHFADGFQVTAQAPGAGVKAKVSKAVSLTVRATPAPASLVSHKPTPSASPSPTPSPSPSTTPTPSPEPTTAEPTPEPTVDAPVEEPAPEPTVDAPVEEPAPEPTAQPEPAPQQAYYSSCREAKAAGAAPLYRGDPGYRSRLDRDGDGVACEK